MDIGGSESDQPIAGRGKTMPRRATRGTPRFERCRSVVEAPRERWRSVLEARSKDA